MTSKVKQLSDIEQWYVLATGLSLTNAQKRIAKITETLKQWGLQRWHTKIVCNTDYRWNERRNRTDLERISVKVGQTNDTQAGRVLHVVWLVPLKTPTL